MTAPAQMPPPPPAPGYASPIPVVRTHLGHALASEWTKIKSVRSTVWTLVLMFVVTVGIGLLFAVALASDDYVGWPLLAGGFFGVMLGQLCIMTLGVLVISSEYGTGMMRTTLTACPHRGRVLLAKTVVFFSLAFVMTLVATTLTSLIHSSLLGDQDIPHYAVQDPYMEGSIENGELVATAGHWMGATVGASLYVSLLGVLGLALGALLRHSAGAITTLIGLVLLPLIAAMFMVGDSMETAREKLIEYSLLNGLASLYRLPMEGDDTATGWPLLGMLAGITVAALIGAYARLTSTDA
ncbi:ABC transporter permease subunit [Streptomyces sp. MP131-18]|uniref:ABC transporter permease subunit n=1 Tax=Streptomyces sp. MP131-18 TaxID=1857892 RepID=UPI00097BE21D|nr:ABC transporter permease subunit [Streptomyces sp. MP131-18]ONK11144.1 ABC-type transport system involved in multi-copper enzyme maturation, permease component [Streptomyces sp. MP131-18]